MATRTATAEWQGTLKEGTGNLNYGSTQQAYNFVSRFEDGTATNPEELLGAAHAACFSMQMGATLERMGFPVTSVKTTAKVNLTRGESGFSISGIDLDVEASVPNLDEAKFKEVAEQTKTGCIVSRALSAVPMTVNARLV